MFVKRATVWFVITLALMITVVYSDIVITTGPDRSGHLEMKELISSSEHQSPSCMPGTIKQVVTHSNCVSKNVANNVCAGSCFSYSLPRIEPAIAGDESLDFCEYCQPSEANWINITMDCTAEDESTYEISKSVQLIQNCSCSSCPGSRPSAESERQTAFLLQSALPKGDYNSNEESQVVSLLSPHLTQTLSTPAAVISSTVAPRPSMPMAHILESGLKQTTQATVEVSEENKNNVVMSSVNKDEIILPINPSSIQNFGMGPQSLHHHEEENSINNIDTNEPLVTNPSKGGLRAMMDGLNDLLRGGGPVKHEDLSLMDLKRILNLQPHHTDRLAGKAVYNGDHVIGEEENNIVT